MKHLALKNIFLAFCTCIALSASAVWSADENLVISFEEDESYRPGSLEGQNGWQINSANVNKILVSPDEGSRNGQYCAKVTQGNTYSNKTLTESSLVEPAAFSIQTRLNPEGFERPGHSRIFLSESIANRRFGGVSFGIEEKEGRLTLFYRDGEERKPLVSEHTVSPQVFYRFEANLHIASRTYDLRVYEDGSSTPLGEISGARFRGDIKEINHLMLNGTPGAYFDEIKVYKP